MVKLSVRYDKELMDNVFVVRNDETYVSSTKTILTITDTHLVEGNHLMYRVELTLNVLREIGSSKIILYDGEDVLDTLTWNGTSISTYYDFPVDTTHSLRARFTGNDHCLGSNSKPYEVYMEATAYNISIDYKGNNVVKTETTFPFEFYEMEGSVKHLIDEGTVTVSYTDGTHSGIFEDVDINNGEATIDFGEAFGNITKGLIDITVVYNGTNNYKRTVKNLQVSKYYNINLRGYWNYGGFGGYEYIWGQDYYLEGSIVDFMGNPYKETDDVSFYGYDGQDWTVLSTGKVGENGKLTFTLDAAESEEESREYTDFGFGTTSPSGDFNAVVTPTYIYPVQFQVNASIINTKLTGSISIETYGYVGDSNVLTRLDYVPVTITDNHSSITYVDVQDIYERVLFEYSMDQYPIDTTLNISCGLAYATHVVHYYLTYYVAPNWRGIDLSLRTTTKQALQTGMKYTAKAAGNTPSAIYLPTPADYKNNSLRFTFTVVDTSNNYFFYGLITDDGVIYLHNFPNDTLGVGDTAEYYVDATNNEVVCTVNGRERFRWGRPRVTYYPAILYVPVGTQDGYVVLNNIRYEVVK